MNLQWLLRTHILTFLKLIFVFTLAISGARHISIDSHMFERIFDVVGIDFVGVRSLSTSG